MIKKLMDRSGLSRFRKKEDGNIFITTALIAPLLVLAVGVGLDTAEIYRAKVNFQNAVDASTLMVTKIVAAEGAQASTKARRIGTDIFNANMRNLDPAPGTANIIFNIGSDGCGSGAISAIATLDHPIFFNAFHKVADDSPVADHVRLTAETEVTCANTTLEIALVLDNSGSMGGWKMSALKESATKLVTTLHQSLASSPAPDPIKFSLVPFNGAVSVGVHNRLAPWMDYYGMHPNHHENFDWEKNPEVYFDGDEWRRYWRNERQTRFIMFDRLREPWGGCVEARPFPLNTTAEIEGQSNPSSLVVPWFAPDEPDNFNGQMSKKRSTDPADKVLCTRFRLTSRGNPVSPERQYCALWSDGLSNKFRHPQDIYYLPRYNDGIEYSEGEYIGDSTPGGAGPWVDDAEISESGFANDYMSDEHNFPLTIRDHPRATPNTGFTREDHLNSDQMKRLKWTWKYFRESGTWPVVNHNYSAGFITGPNFGCTIQDITPLTTSEQDVTDSLDAMVAHGATNIPQGVVWGWRTLSSTEPFEDGRDESDSSNKKVMIIMSDGSNSYTAAWGTGSEYGAYGYAKDGRIYAGVPSSFSKEYNGTDFRKAMDFHLATTCENAKKDGISIYTIAFAVPNASSTKAMLEQCASTTPTGGKQYYSAGDAEQLAKNFADIALRLSDLKVSR